MSTFSAELDVRGTCEDVFDLTQDYARRLDWDPFLHEASLIEAEHPGVGVRSWCATRLGLGMETEYVTFRRPSVAAVRMTRGPRAIASFAGSWRFHEVSEGWTRVRVRYHLVASAPGPARWIVQPILARWFARETAGRLEGLRRYCEAQSAARGALGIRSKADSRG